MSENKYFGKWTATETDLCFQKNWKRGENEEKIPNSWIFKNGMIFLCDSQK